MAAAGVRIEIPIERMAVMGFGAVLVRLPQFLAVLSRAEKLASSADLAVLVDYPAFHLRLAARLRRRGLPVVLYIAPQVWAWRPERARKVASLATKLLVIFEFELPFFRQAGADVEFVGHPLIDELAIPEGSSRLRERLGIAREQPLLALLPGTRTHVWRRLLPIYLEAVKKVRSAKPDVVAAIGTRDGSPLAAGLELPCAPARELLREAVAGMFNSGTASLEAAILGCPGIIGYRMGWFDYMLAKRLVKIPYVGLPNIVYGGEVMRELIQDKLTPEAVAVEMLGLISDDERRRVAKTKLEGVRRKLGPPGASARAAETILKLMRQRG